MTVTDDHDFVALKKRLSNDYGFDVSLKYEDREGDMITLTSQNDFNDLALTGLEVVNVMVSEAIQLPTLQRTRSGSMNTNSTNNYKNNNSLFTNSSSLMIPLASPGPPRSAVSRDFSATNRSSNSLFRTATANAKMDRFPQISDNNSSIELLDREIKWKKGEMLGQGAFGVVYLGLNTETGELMAVKQMEIDEVSNKELSSLDNEINLLRNLRHQNIVRYIGTEVNPMSLSIFLEYVPGGSVKALIDKFGALEESIAKSYTRQLLLGLEYLHRNGIAHRDIKGANCLVGNDGVIKLADFGNSKQWRPTSKTSGTIQQQSGDIKGTPSWMAPEVIRDQGGNISWKKADVWSLACTTLEMTTGKPPWSQFSNSVTILYHIACQETLPEYPVNASVELITFFNVCLQRDPANRPDITSLLLHSFVANIGPNGGWNTAGMGFTQRPSTVSTTPAVGDWATGSSTKSSLSRSERNRSVSSSLVSNTVTGVTAASPTEIDNALDPELPVRGTGNSRNMDNLTSSNFTLGIDIDRDSPVLANNIYFDDATSKDMDIYNQPTPRRHSTNAPAEIKVLPPSSFTTINNSHKYGSHYSNSYLKPEQYYEYQDPETVRELTQTRYNNSSPIDGSGGSHKQLITPIRVLNGDHLMHNDDRVLQSINDTNSPRFDDKKKYKSYVTTSDASDGDSSASFAGPSSIARKKKVSKSAKLIRSNTNRKMQYTKKQDDNYLNEDRLGPSDVSTSMGELHDPGKRYDETGIHATSSIMWERESLQSVTDNDNDIYDDIEGSSVEGEVSMNDFRQALESNDKEIPGGVSTSHNGLRISLTSINNTFDNANQSLYGMTSPIRSVDKKKKTFFVDTNLQNSDNEEAWYDEGSLSIVPLSPSTNIGYNELSMWERKGHAAQGIRATEGRKLAMRSAGPASSSNDIADLNPKLNKITSATSLQVGPSGNPRQLKSALATIQSSSEKKSMRQLPKDKVSREKKENFLDVSLVGESVMSKQKEMGGEIVGDNPLGGLQKINPSSSIYRDPCTYYDVSEGWGDDEAAVTGISEPISLEEHTGAVTRLRIPSNLNMLISSSTDGTIRLWAPNETESRIVLDANNFTVSSKVAETNFAEQKAILKASVGIKSAGTAVQNFDSNCITATSSRGLKVLDVWTEDGCETIWGACSDGALRVWNGADGKSLRFLKGHDEHVTTMEGINGVGGSQMSCLVASGSADKTVRIWDARAKRSQVFLFRGHADKILELRWSECGRSIISGSKDKTIKVWDTRAGRLRTTLEKHFGAINTIRMIPEAVGSGLVQNNRSVGNDRNNEVMVQKVEGISFITGGRDSMMNLWNSNGTCVGTQAAHRGSVIYLSSINYNVLYKPSIIGSPCIISAGADCSVKLWDLRRFKLISEIPPSNENGNITKVAWCGQSVVTSTNNGTVKIWDYLVYDDKQDTKGEWLGRDIANHSQASTDLISNRNLVASASKSGQIIVWQRT